MSEAEVASALTKYNGYLPHRIFHKLLKKFRRKQKRKLASKHRELDTPNECEDEVDIVEYELKREARHKEWLEREKLAQMEWKKREEQRVLLEKEKELQEAKIREDWEALKKKVQEDLEEKERREREEIEKKEQWLKQISELAENDIFSPSFDALSGPPEGQAICPFFSKVAACRFGDRCSRFHGKPLVSTTILIPHFYSNPKWTVAKDDKGDSGLEFEDSEIYEQFRVFYHDVEPEFRSVGQIEQFRVCVNSELHLRGNLYVQYKTFGAAARAFLQFQGRFYAGKQLTVSFVSLPDWNSAVCGWYFTKRCARERNCNFLHVFRNPSDQYSLHRPRAAPSTAETSSKRKERKWSTSSSSPSPERSQSRRKRQLSVSVRERSLSRRRRDRSGSSPERSYRGDRSSRDQSRRKRRRSGSFSRSRDNARSPRGSEYRYVNRQRIHKSRDRRSERRRRDSSRARSPSKETSSRRDEKFSRDNPVNSRSRSDYQNSRQCERRSPSGRRSRSRGHETRRKEKSRNREDKTKPKFIDQAKQFDDSDTSSSSSRSSSESDSDSSDSGRSAIKEKLQDSEDLVKEALQLVKQGVA